MSIEPLIRQVFGAFHNLNLLILRENLHSGRVPRGAWLTGGSLCPIAHGAPNGQCVREMIALGVADLPHACNYAAGLVGADPASLLRFVTHWDGDVESNTGLLRQLEELWKERLSDADAVQGLLTSGYQEVENQT
jgi:hypothetical protein